MLVPAEESQRARKVVKLVDALLELLPHPHEAQPTGAGRTARPGYTELMQILMVCTGNICRSPMAEAILRDELARRGCVDIEVASAGTWADLGNRAMPEALEVLAARGIDFTAHRSRSVDLEELTEADLVVAMTSVHLRELRALVEEVGTKLVLMKELVEMELDDARAPDLSSRLAGLLSAKRPEPRRALDLDDPMGLPVQAYERAAAEIELGVKALAEALCEGPEPASS